MPWPLTMSSVIGMVSVARPGATPTRRMPSPWLARSVAHIACAQRAARSAAVSSVLTQTFDHPGHPDPVQIIEVTEFGVRSAVTRLRRDESPLEFVLYPMIHIGAAAFYADVTSRLRTADVIVAEGVRRGTVRRPSPLLSALTLTY